MVKYGANNESDPAPHLAERASNKGKNYLNMAKAKESDGVERVTLKLPKAIAEYFRKTFPHGKRSDFAAKCIMEYKHRQEVRTIEEQLRKVGKKRQEHGNK